MIQITLACAPLETLEIMTNKAATYDRLEEAGILTPDWSIAKDAGELDRAVAEFADTGREFAVKPLVARGNRGAIVVRARPEAHEHHANARPPGRPLPLLWPPGREGVSRSKARGEVRQVRGDVREEGSSGPANAGLRFGTGPTR